uniref:Ig-like domain-containing protein n=1 Tax=Peromyscus maniculatus bairdii TaxID=230844 RepID=A0A8C8TLJ5_PERMB
MRYLPCLLLWVFARVWGQSEAQRENFPFRCLQISSFANSSCSRTDGLAWLGDVQTHRWSNDSDTISFVKPWSREKPGAWLSKGVSPKPGHEQLQCHVSGFHPKPVWVMWMKGELEQKRTQRGDILPNADGTWYLRATLDVEAGEEAGLACWVKHSSLGGQVMILDWGGRQSSVGVISGVVAVIVVIILSCLVFCYVRKRRSYQDIL